LEKLHAAVEIVGRMHFQYYVGVTEIFENKIIAVICSISRREEIQVKTINLSLQYEHMEHTEQSKV